MKCLVGEWRRRAWLALGLLALTLPAAAQSSWERFFAAVRNDNESEVIALALREFDLNTVDAEGNHALHLAAREGALKVAGFLLDQSAVKVNVLNRHGESPLMIAALKGRLPLVERLLARRAEVNKTGWAPLHYAATHPDPVSADIVRRLLEAHAYIDAESPNRTTPLMMAAHYGHESVVQLLLDEGADVTMRNEQGLSAIDFAHRIGRRSIAERIAAKARASQPAGRW